MRYGLPRLGSKNSIAEWVVSELPRATTFVDVCGGGGSITHAAILSCSDNSGGYAKEIIWTNQRTYDKLSEDRQEMAKWNFAEQMSIFDLMGGN